MHSEKYAWVIGMAAAWAGVEKNKQWRKWGVMWYIYLAHIYFLAKIFITDEYKLDFVKLYQLL